MWKIQKRRSSLTTTTPQRFNNLPLCLRCKDTKFLARTTIRCRCFFFLGNCRSGWPLEVAACHVPSVGGRSFLEAPHVSEMLAQPPLTKKAGNRFVEAFFPACAHRLVAVVNLPTASSLLQESEIVKHCPLQNFEKPQNTQRKKTFFFFTP